MKISELIPGFVGLAGSILTVACMLYALQPDPVVAARQTSEGPATAHPVAAQPQ